MKHATGRAALCRTMTALVPMLMGFLAGCGFAHPYGVTSLRQDASRRTGKALVHYLAQLGADSSVCDRGAPEFAVPRFATRDAPRFVKGLRDGRVPPDVWGSCAGHLLGWLPPEASTELVVRMVSAMITELERDSAPGAELRMRAIEAVLIARPRGLEVPLGSSRRVRTGGPAWQEPMDAEAGMATPAGTQAAPTRTEATARLGAPETVGATASVANQAPPEGTSTCPSIAPNATARRSPR